MKQLSWIILIALGIAMLYIPRLNIVFSISLGMVVLVLGILGLVRSLF